MNLKTIYFSILVSILSYVSADEVLGCGGFIVSHVPIDFSKIVIKLYTKQGILKDQTNCAPNNGYYFIPLYDKGDYVLQLDPPPGWSFRITNVSLTVDGRSDSCSQGKDINFIFWGFGITGKVESFGVDEGPEGVEVELQSKDEVRKAVTVKNGVFFFTPVFPGDYIVTVQHPRWNFFKDKVTVTVVEGNTELPNKSLVIGGFDVHGTVGSDGEVISGAQIFIYSDSKTAHVAGCNNAPEGFLFKNKKPLCYVTSDEKGNFVFPSITNGEYSLVPFYKDHKIHFEPQFLTFTVFHDSVELKEKFEIVGFSVTGKVLNRDKNPINNAVVKMGEHLIATTKNDGTYKIEKVKAGMYTIQITADNYQFEPKLMKVNPSVTALDPLFPNSYRVCGSVVSDKVESVKVLITRVGSTQFITTKSDASSGEFCLYLSAGTYKFEVSSEKKEHGVQFFPISQKIEVTTKPIFDVMFSQLKATVSGKINCLRQGDCANLRIIMKPIGNDFAEGLAAEIKNGLYTFNDIRPGSYRIQLSYNNLCWEEKEKTIVVTSAVYNVPPFVQNGYSVRFESSHNTKLSYNVPGKEPKVGSLNIVKGDSSHCLMSSGSYIFNINSCHTYPTESVHFSTDENSDDIVLTAVKHLTTTDISAAQNFGTIFIAVTIGGVKNIHGPLTYERGFYRLELSLSPSESAILLPQSDILYFNPPILQISGEDDCVDLGVKFQAKRGKVFKGKINPPLQGVQITIETENSDSLIDESDENGHYKFPPLDDSKSYKIIAKKDSYVLLGPDENGNFLAHKLAEILVEVVDQSDGSPLQGALLSLTGGESYRSNLQTNEEGKIAFSSLSPSEYFLKPMMKEYSFEPSSKIINVLVGSSVKVQLMGKRVAYSAYGQITSLNGQPEEQMVIVASGLEECSQYSEEATSEITGSFRIRGLLPSCSYNITVKGSLNDKDIIERATPSSIHVSDITQDIRNIHLIVFRPSLITDVLLNVYTTNPEHYKNLRVKISRESPPSGLVHTIKIDPVNYKLGTDANVGILIQIPSISLDHKTYSIQLESSLTNLNKGKPQVKMFTADSSFKYVEVEYLVKSNVTDQHIKQTSVWTLLIIFGALAGAYNIDKILSFVKDKVPATYVETLWKSKAQANDFAPDNDDIDQIVESINNYIYKKKVKSKRI